MPRKPRRPIASTRTRPHPRAALLDARRAQLLDRLQAVSHGARAIPGYNSARMLLTRHYLAATLQARAELLDAAHLMIRAIEELAARM